MSLVKFMNLVKVKSPSGLVVEPNDSSAQGGKMGDCEVTLGDPTRKSKPSRQIAAVRRLESIDFEWGRS